MSMSREVFAECLQPALDYYNTDLTEQTWQFYYEQLGGMRVSDLKEAVRRHMATLKSFPQVSHLAPQKQTAAKREAPDGRKHPEFGRTYCACIRAFEAKIDGQAWATDETFPIDIGPHVNHAVAYFRKYQHEGHHKISSECRSGIHQHLMKEFERLPRGTEA